MKKIFLPFIIIFCFACKTKIKQKPNFLIGNWIRTNNKPNQKTYEIWNSDFTGLGVTLQEKDTIFREELKIITKNDSLFLKVSGVNESPTYFAFTQQTDSSFVCENPKNEFPKKIAYYLENKRLKAEVSNADFSIEFIFDKN